MSRYNSQAVRRTIEFAKGLVFCEIVGGRFSVPLTNTRVTFDY